jgi:Holliday junction DNA helicase RuvA
VLNIGGGNAAEAVSALVVLGYSQAEAASAVSSMQPDTPVEDMIKAGLKALAAKLG